MFEDLPFSVQKRIRIALEKKLLTNPDYFGISLKKPLEKYSKFRVGEYRIIFKKDKGSLVIVIIAIGNRKNIYEFMSRQL